MFPPPGLGDSFVNEEEDGFLRRQLDAFPDDPHELGHSDVGGHQVLPLIYVYYLRARNLLHYHLEHIWVRVSTYLFYDHCFIHAVETLWFSALHLNPNHSASSIPHMTHSLSLDYQSLCLDPTTPPPLTGTLSGYLLRILADSTHRCSKGETTNKQEVTDSRDE